MIVKNPCDLSTNRKLKLPRTASIGSSLSPIEQLRRYSVWTLGRTTLGDGGCSTAGCRCRAGQRTRARRRSAGVVRAVAAGSQSERGGRVAVAPAGRPARPHRRPDSRRRVATAGQSRLRRVAGLERAQEQHDRRAAQDSRRRTQAARSRRTARQSQTK